MSSIEERIAEIYEEKVNKYLDEAYDDIYAVANEVNDLYFKQANKMYDTLIKQYYLYETTSYVRHWEIRPGTKNGSNLYYGKRFKIHRGKDPYFELNIDASQMAGGYQRDSASQVLENVMNGIRGVPPYWFIPWHGKYSSRYFYYEGDPAHAFETFLSNLSDMATPVFLRRWRERRKNK